MHPISTRCRRRQCPGYGPLWAGDQRRKLFVNLEGYGQLLPIDKRDQARVGMGTVTAPGAGPLPWDEDGCAALGPHRHSGADGCRVRRPEATKWNATAPGSWRDLHRAAYTRCVRRGLRPRLLARVFEMQHRGVLHVHPVLALTTPAEVAGAHAYVACLHELAPRFGFGFVDRKLKVWTTTAAAAYLSAYFVTGSKRKARLQESVAHPDMPRSIIHVSVDLTQATGCTMRRLRLHRYLYVRFGMSPLCVGDTYHELDRYTVGEHGPKRAQERACAAP